MRLLDAAEDLCRAEGWQAVSTRELCARVGITQPGFYRHFATLDELFVELHVRVLDRLADRITAAVRTFDDAAERVRAGWGAYLEFALSEPQLFLSAFNRPATPSLEEDRRGQMQRGLATIREDVVTLDPDDGPVRVLEQWAAVHGLAELALSGRLAPSSGGGPGVLVERLLDRLVGPPVVTTPRAP